MSKLIYSQFIFIIANITELNNNAVFALILVKIALKITAFSVEKVILLKSHFSSRNSGMSLYGQLYIYVQKLPLCYMNNLKPFSKDLKANGFSFNQSADFSLDVLQNFKKQKQESHHTKPCTDLKD